MLPNRVQLSKIVTNKLQNIKNKTGITPNLSSRIALVKALESTTSLVNAGVEDADGQILNRDVLFGEHVEIYELLIREYLYLNSIEMELDKVIAALIEIGVHKISHVKNLQLFIFRNLFKIDRFKLIPFCVNNN